MLKRTLCEYARLNGLGTKEVESSIMIQNYRSGSSHTQREPILCDIHDKLASMGIFSYLQYHPSQSKDESILRVVPNEDQFDIEFK
jgi:hypothetical protein